MDNTPQKTSRRWLRWTLITFGSLFVVLAVTGLILGPRMRPMLREKLVEVLREHYGSNVVDLKDVNVTWYFPLVVVTADGVTLHRKGQTDPLPLIEMQRIRVHTDIRGVWEKPYKVRKIEIEGMRIHIPPRQSDERKKTAQPGPRRELPDFLVDEVIADGTVLEIHRKKPGAEPMTWEIEELRLRSAGTYEPMRFQAVLTNAVPPGLIHSNGTFGPWDREEPGDTPVAGHYTFDDADLSVFNGISGILSSVGDYSGQLNHLDVKGTTDIPDFRVNVGQKVQLKTEFTAVVDGTNGDTYLQPVNAHFLQTDLVARGKVEGTDGVKGKTIALGVVIRRGRVEDLMHLTTKGEPTLRGGVAIDTKFVLPPGKRDIIDKLVLDGKFTIDEAKFTNADTRQKIVEMSARAQGRPKEINDPELAAGVAANFTGEFNLKDSEITFSRLIFYIPGAQVSLAGGYGLRSDALDFQGNLRMQAKISQTQTGIKSILLKAVDPFFTKQGAGTVVPIKIAGTRTTPQFGLNFRGGSKDKERTAAAKN